MCMSVGIVQADDDEKVTWRYGKSGLHELHRELLHCLPCFSVPTHSQNVPGDSCYNANATGGHCAERIQSASWGEPSALCYDG